MNSTGKARNAVILSIIVVITALAIWMRRQEMAPRTVIGTAPAAREASAAPPPEPARAGDSSAAAISAPASAQPPVPNAASAGDREFQQWLSREARQLDAVNVDGEAKRREIRAKMKAITPAQSRQLAETAKNPKAPAAEKILSAYLLVEGGGRTERELTDLITSPLKEDPNFEPHSEEEMKGIREKSLRIMAIDGLFSRARHEPSAREQLARAARETPDPGIRAYAADKLRQLQ